MRDLNQKNYLLIDRYSGVEAKINLMANEIECLRNENRVLQEKCEFLLNERRGRSESPFRGPETYEMMEKNVDLIKVDVCKLGEEIEMIKKVCTNEFTRLEDLIDQGSKVNFNSKINLDVGEAEEHLDMEEEMKCPEMSRKEAACSTVSTETQTRKKDVYPMEKRKKRKHRSRSKLDSAEKKSKSVVKEVAQNSSCREGGVTQKRILYVTAGKDKIYSEKKKDIERIE